MASTRDINAPGNYAMEQETMKKQRQHMLYPLAGHPDVTQFPGTGLLPGRVANDQLSRNYIDIESQLYGISTTNLVTPLPPVQPDILPLTSLHIHERTPLVKPPLFHIEPNQRLRLFHS